MTVRDYLEKMVEMHAEIGHPALMERFVLRNGTFSDRLGPAGPYKPTKQCFKNAFELAQRRQELTYVEGYGLDAHIGLAMHHAWCVNNEGAVLDNTWRVRGREGQLTYVGVPFTTVEAARVILKNKVYGLLDPGMINIELMLEKDPGLAEFVPAGLVEKVHAAAGSRVSAGRRAMR